MRLYGIGVNHKSALVAVREKLAFPPEAMTSSLQDLTAVEGVQEAVIVSTCNRSEIYALLADQQPVETLVDWLCQSRGLSRHTLDECLYVHEDRAMVEHLMRVASGLDSLVLGEPQILGQIKQSYQLSREAGVLGKTLNRLFQHVFKAAKQIRTETAISSNPVSVAFAAVSLSKQIFTHLADQSVLLIGAGEMVALCARHMRENGVSQVTIANRTLHRAAALAHEFQAQAVVLEDIPDVLENIDIIISSTASPLPLLGKGLIERALKKRKNRPMFMVDLAIPRDIEPEVGTLNGVYLYTLDDLGSVVEENKRSREAAAEEAQELVDLQVREFVSWVQSMDAFSAIQLYRQQAESLRDEVLKRVVKPHQKDGYSEEDLRALAYQLTNKLIHMPSVCLRNAGAEGDAEQLHLAQKLLLPTVAE